MNFRIFKYQYIRDKKKIYFLTIYNNWNLIINKFKINFLEIKIVYDLKIFF
jgi:hypothetical protein